MSGWPVTVSSCQDFQLLEVKLRLSGLTLPSPASLLAALTVTLSVGSLLRRTEKLAVPLSSEVSPETALTKKPAAAVRARFSTCTSAGSRFWDLRSAVLLSEPILIA